MKAAIYARVSTTDQNCELQLGELREYVVRHGWENAVEYVDIRDGHGHDHGFGGPAGMSATR